MKKYKKAFSAQEKNLAIELFKKHDIIYAMHKVHCSKSSIYLWRKKLRENNNDIKKLEPNYHAPYSHKKQHTQREIENIKEAIAQLPDAGFLELYTTLKKNYNYLRSCGGCYNFLKRHKMIENSKLSTEKYILQKYYTPLKMGYKMQLDVKHVPRKCCTNKSKKYYQYSIMDEATRQRFLYGYDKLTQNNTIDFVTRAINYFGYIPKIIQTDNGQEFTSIVNSSNHVTHFTDFCDCLGIVHKCIRPRTPRHNGKIERSHRNDQKRFYSTLKIKTLEEFNKKLSAYLERSNNIVSSALHFIGDKKTHIITPMEKRAELEHLNLVVQ